MSRMTHHLIPRALLNIVHIKIEFTVSCIHINVTGICVHRAEDLISYNNLKLQCKIEICITGGEENNHHQRIASIWLCWFFYLLKHSGKPVTSLILKK